MLLRFTKMHGLGNDFMVVDLVTQSARFNPEKVRLLANRHTGVGFDQLLLVEPPTRPEMDFQYRIFNADGSEVEQCGNGARCFARFVQDHKLSNKTELNVQTAKGDIILKIQDNGDVTVNMGAPRLQPTEIPFQAEQTATSYTLTVDEQPYEVSAISMGNPHGVIIVEDLDEAPVTTLGPKIEHHSQFPERCNAGFMQVLSRTEVRLRVWERGVGETLACGTGACAAMVAGKLRGLLDDDVQVHLPGGSLQIQWAGEGEPVIMTGSATRVFEGHTRI